MVLVPASSPQQSSSEDPVDLVLQSVEVGARPLQVEDSKVEDREDSKVVNKVG